MLRFHLHSPGKIRSSWLAAGIDEYRRRLAGFAPIELHWCREHHRHAEPDRARRLEAEEMAAQLAPNALVVALDLAGEEFSSEELAGLLERWEEEGVRDVALVVGGHLGLADSLLQRARLRWRLSRLTFTHEMARLVVLEQLYRAWTIRRNTGYHR